ncbi:hypothetical protein NTE_00479 [Candidatus Nitrososphaera evergladensis SR1]|uniref:Uncharacterized protein n=2 Tax=Nitrososphaera TaxID=497726 RepID=A0A075MN35_9ARCH|nr:hypothetical protein NTE_00479 [Candidatus Nitrososphaera evergladensis SR1]
MQRLHLLSALAGAVLFFIAFAVVVYLPSSSSLPSYSQKDYEIKVESTSDSDKGFYGVNEGAIITSKVTLENSGRKPLADVQIKYMSTVRCEQHIQLDDNDVPDSLRSDLTKAIRYDEEGGSELVSSFIQEHKNQIDGIGLVYPEDERGGNGEPDLFFYKIVEKERLIDRETIKAINPAERISLSPPSGAQYVVVDANYPGVSGMAAKIQGAPGAQEVLADAAKDCL